MPPWSGWCVKWYKNTITPIHCCHSIYKQTSVWKDRTHVDYYIYNLFVYSEGHHDPPLVTLFVVTELDLCRHDPDDMINDLQWYFNYERYKKSWFIHKVDINFDYFTCYIIWVRWRTPWSATCHFIRSNWAWLVPPWSGWYVK